MDNNRSAIIKELIAIGLVIVLLLAAGSFLVRNVVVGLQSLDDTKMAEELDSGAFEKALRELAGKILPADGKKTAPALPQPPAPVSSAGETKTPAVTGKKGEVTNVRFFEGGREIPALKQRTYASQFTSRARSIYIEIAYKNNGYKVADATIPLVIQYLDPAGQKVAELKKTAQPKMAWATAVFATGVSSAEVGSWRTGQYTVKLFFDGDFIGDYKITIE